MKSAGDAFVGNQQSMSKYQKPNSVCMGYAEPNGLAGWAKPLLADPLTGYSKFETTCFLSRSRCRSLAYSVNCQQALATWQTVVQYPTQNPLQQRTTRDYLPVCACVCVGPFIAVLAFCI